MLELRSKRKGLGNRRLEKRESQADGIASANILRLGGRPVNEEEVLGNGARKVDRRQI